MSNPQGGPGNSLGLAVGATNLAGTGDGQRPVIRPSTVTLRPELTLTGFVDRVGDPFPMVAAGRFPAPTGDAARRGARRRGPQCGDGAGVGGGGGGARALAPVMVDALRDALRSKPGLARSPLVSDAAAAVTALRSNPGLPSTGVIVLCDFGGSGSSITLVDAAADAPIGDTVRVPDFSGDQIDQAVLTKVVAESSTPPTPILPAPRWSGRWVDCATSAGTRRNGCPTRLPPPSSSTCPARETTVRMTRMELDDLIDEPLADFIATLATRSTATVFPWRASRPLRRSVAARASRWSPSGSPSTSARRW